MVISQGLKGKHRFDSLSWLPKVEKKKKDHTSMVSLSLSYSFDSLETKKLKKNQLSPHSVFTIKKLVHSPRANNLPLSPIMNYVYVFRKESLIKQRGF